MVEWCTVSHGTSHAATNERYQYTTSMDIKNMCYKMDSHSFGITCDMCTVSLLDSRELCCLKVMNYYYYYFSVMMHVMEPIYIPCMCPQDRNLQQLLMITSSVRSFILQAHTWSCATHTNTGKSGERIWNKWSWTDGECSSFTWHQPCHATTKERYQYTTLKILAIKGYSH